MNRRELAREYFKKCNLTYADIDLDAICQLIQYLNNHIREYGSCMVIIKDPILSGKDKNVIFDTNNKLKFAELRVKGTYFDDREAITFNDDGWIGFCGWADTKNLAPFVVAFKEWCDWLKNKVGEKND